jgi:hypothetical protein
MRDRRIKNEPARGSGRRRVEAPTSIDALILQDGRQSFRTHARSLERHAAWARDFAVAGELDSAIDALHDIRAIAMELTTTAGAA